MIVETWEGFHMRCETHFDPMLPVSLLAERASTVVLSGDAAPPTRIEIVLVCPCGITFRSTAYKGTEDFDWARRTLDAQVRAVLSPVA